MSSVGVRRMLFLGLLGDEVEWREITDPHKACPAGGVRQNALPKVV
jgi:hypothetical protein